MSFLYGFGAGLGSVEFNTPKGTVEQEALHAIPLVGPFLRFGSDHAKRAKKFYAALAQHNLEEMKAGFEELQDENARLPEQLASVGGAQAPGAAGGFFVDFFKALGQLVGGA